VVEVGEHDQRRSRRSFFAVRKEMVRCQSADEDGDLVDGQSGSCPWPPSQWSG
jgi:hypothetical protein